MLPNSFENKTYLQQLRVRKKSGDSTAITAIVEKKDSWLPLMLGADLDGKVRAYIQEARRLGNTKVVMACALGIVREKVACLLSMGGTL